jgi:transposase
MIAQNQNVIAHESKTCKNCLSETVKKQNDNPLDDSVDNFKCQVCGTEEKVYK